MEQEKLSTKEKFSYGLGDFAQNGMFTFMSSYLLFFCTDIAKINLGAAGVILGLGRIADAVFSPLAGGILDRTETRWGKCRPYILFTIFPEGVLLALVFFVPDFSEKGKIWYIGTVYLLFSIVYAVVSVAYSTLLSLMTRNEGERLSLNLFKNIGAAAGGILVTSVTLKAVNLFSAKQQNGFWFIAIIFSSLFVSAGFSCAKHTMERVKPEKTKKLSCLQAFRITVKSRAWLILCMVHFAELFYYGMRSQGVIYYSKYYLREESFGAVLLTITQTVTLLIAFVMPKLSKAIGNRRCVLFGNLIWCIAMVGNYAAGRQKEWIVFFSLLSSVGWAVATGIMFVMISETIDYTEKFSGCRPDGFITSTVVFVMKIGTAAAGVAASKVLELGGYMVNAPVTRKVELVILLNYIGIPTLMAAVVVILICFYPSGEETFCNKEETCSNGL